MNRENSAPQYKGQDDAILGATAYYRKDFRQSAIWFPSHEHTNVRLSMAAPFPRAADTRIDFLDRLPLELLYYVLLHLDMQSLFHFRQVNLRSRQILHTLQEYRMVASLGLDLYCTLLRTGFAKSVSLSDVYGALCTKACAICGEFGGFISLLTSTRCCVRCLHGWCLAAQGEAIYGTWEEFHLTEAELNRFTSFKTSPGVFSTDQSKKEQRHTIDSDHRAMFLSGLRERRPLPGWMIWATRQRKTSVFDFAGACAVPYYDKKTGEVEHGVCCAGCQLALEIHLQIWPVGYDGGYDDGVYEARNKVYTRAEFLEHFQRCGQAHVLWKSSNEGKNISPKLPSFVRRGGYHDWTNSDHMECQDMGPLFF